MDITTNLVHAQLATDSRPAGLIANKRMAVIWIDWYSYHLARFRALAEHPLLKGNVFGIELVGGAGVHGAMVFRDAARDGLAITTLEPDQGWAQAGQLRLARLLWAKLNEMDPDVVLIPGCYTLPGLAASIWARVHGKTPILMSESTLHDHPRSRYKESLKAALMLRLYDAAIGGGVRQLDYLRALGFREEQIARLYDVVDNDYFKKEAEARRLSTTAEELGLPANYFLYVGRLSEEKNVDGLIRAYAQYRRAGGQWVLVLVGDGLAAASLKQLAANEGVAEAVVFTGLKNTREIVSYYAFASCFVLPSQREPWGLVVNEAMAAGLPVIVSDRVGCSDDLLEPEQNGYKFDPSQPEQLTRALESVSGAGDERLRRMGECSQEIVARYSPPMWAEEVIRIASFGLSANSGE